MPLIKLSGFVINPDLFFISAPATLKYRRIIAEILFSLDKEIK